MELCSFLGVLHCLCTHPNNLYGSHSNGTAKTTCNGDFAGPFVVLYLISFNLSICKNITYLRGDLLWTRNPEENFGVENINVYQGMKVLNGSWGRSCLFSLLEAQIFLPKSGYWSTENIMGMVKFHACICYMKSTKYVTFIGLQTKKRFIE